MSDKLFLKNNSTLLTEKQFNTKAKAYYNIIKKMNLLDESNLQNFVNELVKPFEIKAPVVVLDGEVEYKENGSIRYSKYSKASHQIRIPNVSKSGKERSIETILKQLTTNVLQSLDLKYFKFGSISRCSGFISREEQMFKFLGIIK